MPVLLKKRYAQPLKDVEDEIVRRLRGGDAESFIYIVPTRRKIRALQRTLLGMVPGGISTAFNLFTVETFAEALHAGLARPKRLIGGALQGVIFLEAIRSVESGLSYVRLRGKSRSLPPGTFQKIVHVINYLKERGIYLPVLHDELQHSEIGERSKLTDILRIYEAYEKLLGERFIDIPGIFREVNEGWSTVEGAAKFAKRFPRCNSIFVSGFDEFSDPELTMLHNCSEIRGIGTVVAFDYHPENDEVFGHLRENYEKFLGMGFHRESVPPRERSEFQAHAARHLFQTGESREHDAKGKVTIASVRDRAREVELVAKIIKRLVAERPGRDLGAICVSMFQPQLYTQLFREIFHRYGIPANITDRYSLHQSPVVVAIMSLLVLPEKNFQLAWIARALSTPYLRLAEGGGPEGTGPKGASSEGAGPEGAGPKGAGPKGAGQLDAGNILSVASRLKISGGRAFWIRRIDERREWIVNRLREGAEEFEEEELRREDETLVAARRDLHRVFALLARFDAPMRPAEFRTQLLAMLKEIHVADALLELRGQTADEVEVAARAYEKFLGFTDEFVEILAMEGKSGERQPLSFYTERLKHAVAQERFNVRQRYGYGVNVTSFDETRGLNFEVMFLVGLLDSECPRVYQPEIFFSASRRERREKYHLQEQRYRFYQALSNFSDHVYLTYPLAADNRESIPSSFIDAVRNIVSVSADDGTLAEEASAGIYSTDELQRYAGGIAASVEEQAPADEVRELFRKELGLSFDAMRDAIRIEQSRVAGVGMPEFNGIIAGALSPGAGESLEQFRQRTFSVTQLESYGKCPFQYFAARVLRLVPLEEPEDALTPVERGDLIHEILFEFFVSRRAGGKGSLAGADEEEFQSALADLLSIARRNMENLGIVDVFRDVENETLLGSVNRKGVLREVLEHERKRDTKTSPSYFEVGFGLNPGRSGRTDPTLSHPGPVTAGSVSLRGKIDRIEMGESFFSIIDYKSGKHPGRREIDLGISLQLPLYLYAVEFILHRLLDRELTPAAGLYYDVKSDVRESVGIGSAQHNGVAFPKARKSNRLVADDAGLREVIDDAVAIVNEYVDTIAKGRFPVDPKDPRKVCEYCDFQTTCRIQLRRPVDDKRSGETS